MNPENITRTMLSIVFSALCFLLQGQSFELESILDKLKSENIITDEGRAFLKTQYGELEKVRASTVLRGLTEVYGGEFLHRSRLYPLLSEMNKRRATSTPSPTREKIELNFEEPMVTSDPGLEGKEPEPGMMTSSFMSGKGVLQPGVVPGNQSVFGRNLISLSDKLVETGLISPSFKDEYIPPTEDELIPEYMALMLYTFYLEELEKQPARLKKVLARKEDWLENGILVESVTIDESELSEVFDLVKYSPYGIELRRGELSQDAKEGYGEIFARVSDLTGVSMELQEFDFILEADTAFSTTTLSAAISVERNNVAYRDTFFYAYAGMKKTVEEAKRTRFTLKFTNVINEILSDANECSRLYYINAGESGYSSDKIGLMYLEKEPYFAIKKTSKTYFIFGPHPEKSLNECSSERLINEAIEIGLITRGPSQEVMDRSESLVEAIVKSCNDNFDPLYKIEGLTNEMLLSLLEKNSKGSIRFSGVQSEDISSDSLAFSFVYDGVTHQQTLSKKRSYDYSLYLSLKKILKFKDKDPQFYTVSRMMDDFGMTFLTIEQRDWIEKNGNNFYTNRFVMKN